MIRGCSSRTCGLASSHLLSHSLCATLRPASCWKASSRPVLRPTGAAQQRHSVYAMAAVAITTTGLSGKMMSTAKLSDDVKADYDAVCDKLREISNLSSISGLIDWDEMVMMPSGAAEARAKQKAALSGVLHEKRVDPALGEALSRLDKRKDKLGEVEAAVVRDALRNYTRAATLTKALAQRKAELESRGYKAWVEARKASDFSKFAPVLQEWVDYTKEVCALIAPGRPAYDVCLDVFEKGMTAERVDEIFSQVKRDLVPLLAAIRASKHKPDASWLMAGGGGSSPTGGGSKQQQQFDVDTQAALCNEIAVDLGFNIELGRLDCSVHPFTGGAHPTDVRMTTRFKPDNVMEGITGAIHETGHSLYEQGRNLDFDGLPVNEAMSMGIHESQSLLWERCVGLSRPFSQYLLPKLKAAFPQQLGSAPQGGAAELYAAMNQVQEPSFIRVEADEVSYPMHIILRYELERGLLDGSIQVDDLPQLWADKMEEYLGERPPSDAQGVLQDVHWSMGAFSYFPTYSLGAIYAVQIFEAAKRALPDLEADISCGQFSGLRTWLNANIHAVGSLYPNGDELMRQVTGEPLNPSIFMRYLRAKYSDLYRLEGLE